MFLLTAHQSSDVAGFLPGGLVCLIDGSGGGREPINALHNTLQWSNRLDDFVRYFYVTIRSVVYFFLFWFIMKLWQDKLDCQAAVFLDCNILTPSPQEVGDDFTNCCCASAPVTNSHARWPFSIKLCLHQMEIIILCAAPLIQELQLKKLNNKDITTLC